MEYTIIVEDRSYELPKKTIRVMTNLDEALKVDSAKGLSMRQKFEKLHTFLKNVVGDDACREMFGTDKLEEIDLSELAITVKKVAEAYDKPINDYDIEKSMNKLGDIPFEKLISIAGAVEKMSNITSAT